MDVFQTFSETSLGESHKEVQKPCQDYSADYSNPESGLYIALVSDGHGGRRYFRSDRGSRFAVEIAMEAVKQFVAYADGALFSCRETSVKAQYTLNKEGVTEKDTEQQRSFRQLFASIISQWEDTFRKDWEQDPPTDKEYASLSKDHAMKFKNGYRVETAYGCTLLGVVYTPSYWFAFHLGDGKCIGFRKENGDWYEPIPWDDRCFLNGTTSLCDGNALDGFRFCYGKRDTAPAAVFIGSDGMDDSYIPISNLATWYEIVLRSFVKNGYDATRNEIKSFLPQLSKQGSKDDMSLAAILDLSAIEQMLPILLARRKLLLRNTITQAQDKVIEAEQGVRRCKEILEEAQSHKTALESNYSAKKSLYEQQKRKKSEAEQNMYSLQESIAKLKLLITGVLDDGEKIRSEIEKNQILLDKYKAEYNFAHTDYTNALHEKNIAECQLNKLMEEFPDSCDRV